MSKLRSKENLIFFVKTEEKKNDTRRLKTCMSSI